MAAPMTMNAAECVSAALRAFDHGTTVCIPGWLNSTLAQAPRLAPRVVVRKAAARVFQLGG